jgi:hypothetical protein
LININSKIGYLNLVTYLICLLILIAIQSKIQLVVADYDNNPADGVRGKGAKRKQEHINMDANLLAIYESRNQRAPLNYLRALAHRLPDVI